MSDKAVNNLALGYQFAPSEFRKSQRVALERADKGGVSVVRREEALVVLQRKFIDHRLAPTAKFRVLSSVTDDQVSFWLEDVPVHAVGNDIDEAEDAFLDALIDYADLWQNKLRYIPNHAQNEDLVMRVAMYAGEREEFRNVVFDDE